MAFEQLPSNSIVTVFSTSDSFRFKLFLDKVNFFPHKKLNVSELIQFWDSKKLKYSLFVSKNGSSSGYEVSGIRFIYSKHDTKEFSFIVSNPSDYPSYKIFLEALVNSIPSDFYNKMKVSRVDIAFDLFGIPMPELLRGMDIPRKQYYRFNDYKSGKIQSISFGVNASQVKVYNKREQVDKLKDKSKYSQVTDNDWVRFEIVVKRKSLPTKDISRLKEGLLSLSYNPFRGIKYERIKFKRYAFKTTRQLLRQERKLTELKVLTSTLGFTFAKRYISKRDNFGRNYEKYCLVKYAIDFGQVYHDELNLYFSEEKAYVH